MHSYGDLLPPDRAAEPWPADDCDTDWPADWPVPAGPEPSARRRAPRIAALTLTALVALGAGAGAVYEYQNGLAPSAQAASRSQGSTAGPGVRGGAAARSMLLVGPVRAIGRAFVTVGGGPIPEISAQVTSATQFTGSARSIAQIDVGDTVAVQITESNGVATAVSLQDPATAK